MSVKLNAFWPLNVKGAPGSKSCSLAQATTLPVVVRAPRRTSKLSAVMVNVPMAPVVPCL